MKTKIKIILSILFLLSLCLITSPIYAVGQVYYSVIDWESDHPTASQSPHILYRTVVRPHGTTEQDLIWTRENKYNEWYEDGYNGAATVQTYKSRYLIFTKDMIGRYTEDSSSPYGYLQYNIPPESADLISSPDVEDFEKWQSQVTTAHIKASVEDKWLYTFVLDTNYDTVSANYDASEVEGYLDNIYNVGTENATLQTGYVYPSNGKSYMKAESGFFFQNKLVPYEEARRMVYNSSYTTKGELLKDTILEGSLYVSDIKVNEEATKKLINEATGEKIYVSALSETVAWDNTYLFYMLTPTNFLHAKSALLKTSNWSAATLGEEQGGWASGLNLWDNELVLNSAPSNKTIVINHINVTEDSEGNKVFVPIKTETETYTVGSTLYLNKSYASSGSKYISTAMYGDNTVRYFMTNDFIDELDSKFTVKSLKEKMPNTNLYDDSGNILKANEYEVLGYASYFGTDDATVIGEAGQHTLYKQDELQSSGTFQFTTNEDETSLDVAVINVYYEAPTIDIEVRHYYVGQYYISGNGFGLVDGVQLAYSKKDDTYGFEYYNNFSVYDSITFSKNPEMDGVLNYIGYDIYEAAPTGEQIQEIPQNTDDEYTVESTIDDKDKKIIIVFKYQTLNAVTVRHALYDENGNYQYLISGLGSGSSPDGTIQRMADKVENNVEYYILKNGEEIQFGVTAYDENVEYLGYEANSTKAVDISSLYVQEPGRVTTGIIKNDDGKLNATEVIFKYKLKNTGDDGGNPYHALTVKHAVYDSNGNYRYLLPGTTYGTTEQGIQIMADEIKNNIEYYILEEGEKLKFDVTKYDEETLEYLGYEANSGDNEIDINNTNIQSTNIQTGYMTNYVEQPTEVIFKYKLNNDIIIDNNSNVVIQHVFFDDDGGTKVLAGNRYGMRENAKVSPIIVINNVEYYYKTSVEVWKFQRVSNEYEYLGYELTEIENNNIDEILESHQESTYVSGVDEEVTEDSESYVITFKYTLEPPKETPKPPPEPDVDGELGIESIEPVDTTCDDIYSVPGNAVDNKADIFAGIKGIPKYILAGLNVQKLTHSGSAVNINVTIKFGNESKTWSIEVPYYLSFYAVNRLAMYEYEYANVYNTESGYDTSGTNLFSTSDDIRKITPVNTSKLVLWSSVDDDITGAQNSWKSYLRTSYKTNYTPTTDPNRSGVLVDNPYDILENMIHTVSGTGYRRVTEVLYGYEPSSGGFANTELSHSMLDNSITEYITYNSEDAEAAAKTQLRKAWTAIVLDKSADITITLLSEDMFNAIEYNEDGDITNADIQKRVTDTDNLINNGDKTSGNKGISTLLEEFVKAYDDYDTACADNGGYKMPNCYEDAYEDYEQADERCNAADEDCSDAGEDEECEPVDWECGDTGRTSCENCGKYETYVYNLEGPSSNYKDAYDAYNYLIEKVKLAYEAEKIALQNIDEAMYIQDYLWKKYKEYNTEQIAKLLGIDIKFEYSSGGAKLVENSTGKEVELMTVKTESAIELLTKDGKALNGNLVGNTYAGSISMNASRQTLTAEQKTYYTTGIPSSWIAENITSKTYSNNSYIIPKTALNGKRILAANATYTLYNKLGNGKISNASAYKDNMYYGITNNEVGMFTLAKTTLNYHYGSSKGNSQTFNIYTPLVVSADVNQDIDVIDQTVENKYSGVDIIQANSNFTVNFSSNYSDVAANKKVYGTDAKSDFTERYLNKARYYIKFEFDVDNVKFTDSRGYTVLHGSAKANTWIGPIYGDSISATARLNTQIGDTVTDMSFNYYVLAAAINTKESWTKLVLQSVNTDLSDINNSALLNNLYNICGVEGGTKKISYYASYNGTLVIVNRMYDFRVTDLKDVDWKDVFRQNEDEYYVNYHTGIAYWSGLNKLNTEDPTKYNEIIGRTEEEIGISPRRVLPLGPYKNMNKSYISAPKMGYRFSFDLKVTGAPDKNKSVTIEPSFYYISKDGKTYYSEYTSGKQGIYLFYKNSSGQYVRIGSSSDNYKIQFVPNDGYRSLVQAAQNNLSKTNVVLGNLRKLTLNFKDVTTYSTNDSTITYYGEYKLPNSTIAVLVDSNGKYNINKPLTNGYIGVVFDIYANEPGNVAGREQSQLSYSKDSFIPGGESKAKVNSSQWDYEGYLGISKPGESYSTTIKLEKGTWTIDNAMYNKIKGTVILYDTDAKASNDFN